MILDGNIFGFLVLIIGCIFIIIYIEVFYIYIYMVFYCFLFLFYIQKRWKEFFKEDLFFICDYLQNRVMVEKYNGKRIGLEDEKLIGFFFKVQDIVEESSERYVLYMCQFIEICGQLLYLGSLRQDYFVFRQLMFFLFVLECLGGM